MAEAKPDLHAQIMNIPCKVPDNGPRFQLAYKEGHRDARHAAAELVSAARAMQEVQAGWNAILSASPAVSAQKVEAGTCHECGGEGSFGGVASQRFTECDACDGTGRAPDAAASSHPFALEAAKPVAAELSDEQVIARCAAAGISADEPMIVMTGYQLRAAAEFVNPDAGDTIQLESEVCIQWGPERDDGEGGKEPAGLRVWLADYPEEGSMHLDPDKPWPPADVASTSLEAAKPVAQPGYKMVPTVPTQAMLDAADKIIDADPRFIARAYRAMLAASPTAPAPATQPKETE